MKRTSLCILVSLSLAALAVAGCKKKDKDKPSEKIKRPKAIPGKHVLVPKTPPKPKFSLTVEGFATPESVLYDADADVYLVSNINGKPTDADGNGFISRVTPDGKVAALKWIDGASKGVTLNGPKGLAVVGDTLYVSDLTFVRMFDRKTGKSKGQIEIKGSTFLNDLAAGPDGTVYVSDSGMTPEFKPNGSDAIYAIKDGKAKPLIKQAKDDDLGAPNGLLVKGDLVWVVTFRTGEIYSVSKDGKRAGVKKLPKGSLDGIVPAGDGKQVLISSWASQAVFIGPVGGPWMEAVKGVKAPADIDVDTKRKRVLIPLFQDNQLLIRGL